MYNVRDAQKARWRYLINEGFAESAIDCLSDRDWVDHDGRRFTYEPDEAGQIELEVKFIDDDGTAEILFADGDMGTVCINAMASAP